LLAYRAMILAIFMNSLMGLLIQMSPCLSRSGTGWEPVANAEAD